MGVDVGHILLNPSPVSVYFRYARTTILQLPIHCGCCQSHLWSYIGNNAGENMLFDHYLLSYIIDEVVNKLQTQMKILF